jgi:hypothetical protein
MSFKMSCWTRERGDLIAHYSVGIDVDAQAIVRGVSPEKKLIRLARSMSAIEDHISTVQIG